MLAIFLLTLAILCVFQHYHTPVIRASTGPQLPSTIISICSLIKAILYLF